MAELPPPPDRKGGWYPDPEGSGRLRWWGGQKWSEHFKDAPGGARAVSKEATGEKSAGASAGEADPGPLAQKKGQWLGAPWWAWLLGAFVVLVIVSAIAGGNNSDNNGSTKTVTQAAQTPSVKTVTQAAPAATTTPAPTTTAAPAPQEPDLTAGQENALQAAQDYIDISGFSRASLIQQLSSSAGEGFSKADATYAADHVGADWNAEAVESAQDYLSMGGFSRSSLIEQLSSPAGEGFTLAQAQYAVDKVYGH